MISILIILLSIAIQTYAQVLQPLWAQCGGIGWTGSTMCVAGSFCSFTSAYYSQCIIGTLVPQTFSPTQVPTASPSLLPTASPTNRPTVLGETNNPTISPTPMPTMGAVQWSSFSGFTFAANTINTVVAVDITACQQACTLGCDFFSYNPSTKQCKIKYTDKTMYAGVIFSGQTGYLPGRLIGMTLILRTSSATTSGCGDICTSTASCKVVVFDTTNPAFVECSLYTLTVASGEITGFRLNPRQLNYDPINLGRIDDIGNAGIVCIFANLLPNGKVHCGARPEYQRGGPNHDNIARPTIVPYGEIASVFDPTSGTSIPTQVDDNIFCHAAILLENGELFTAGGDDGTDPTRAAAIGLRNGLQLMRTYDYNTNTYTYGSGMARPRWYPTAVRTISGKIMIIGGMANGAGEQIRNLEIYKAGVSPNQVVPSPVIDFTGTASYVKPAIVPGTGHIFFMTYRSWAIIDKDTGVELEREGWTPNGANLVQGRRSGAYIAASLLLPIHESNGYKAEYALFGGAETITDAVTNTVARMVITDPVGTKKWTYDTDLMPYGRVVSDAVLQPNGKVLIMNGARKGETGGAIAAPLMSAAASGK